MEMKEKIIELFRKYGFEYRKSASNGDFLAFTFKSGFFYNAELVSLGITEKERIEKEMDVVVRELEQLNFSTKKSFYSSIDDIEKKLFDGFFHVKQWKIKIKDEYTKHCDRILSVLPKEAATYTYIQVPYLKNNNQSEKNIIKSICDDLFIDGPQLSIIEAPAGFGKTCTSYEIIKSLIDDYVDAPIPFFTEFSRDRQARIFNHIFIREVDKSFSSVNSDVVIEEVKEGRIVVVLDGFDELLHDNSSDKDIEKNFDNAEPMLETISELLTQNAKVILTSRRSAIFDGEMFNEWVKRYDSQFTINRYRLDKPEIKDWITAERLEKLDDTDIAVDKLANPVLLSFLRFVNDDYFIQLCEKPSLIVDKYFLSMLEREMDRQQLIMNPEQQTELLRLIAADMCEKNYTSDAKEKIINVIKDKASHLLNAVRSMYSPKDKPTIDKLATTLSNHAFFDRSNQGDNHIEFVNEFVFGNYIAESILKSSDDWIASDERFVEPAVLAYVARDIRERNSLWIKLSPMNDFLDASSKMKFEAALTDHIQESKYDDTEISSIIFKSFDFFKTGKIKRSIFNECIFKNIDFYFENFHDITFLNCKFWDCNFKENHNINIEVDFYNCEDNNNFISKIDNEENISDLSNDKREISYYILSKIWPIGSLSLERLQYFTANLFKTNSFSRKDIIKEIKLLKKEGILIDAHNSNFIAINKTKINEIKNILDRS